MAWRELIFMAALTDTPEMAAERAGYVALDLMRCAACGRVWFVRRGQDPEICPCGGELVLSAKGDS